MRVNPKSPQLVRQTEAASPSSRPVLSDHVFRSMSESAPVGITLARHGFNLYTNPAYLRMFGFEHPSELLGAPLLEQIAPEHRAEIADRVKRRMMGEDVPTSYETVGLRKDGTLFPFHVDVGMIQLEDGPATLAFFTDISGRKSTEMALRESERRFREMLERVQLVSVLLDLDGRVTFCNDYLANLSGYSKDQIVGQLWFDLFIPPDQLETVKRSFFTNLLQGQIPAYAENEILKSNGERRLISWNNTLLRDSQGRIIGTSSIGSDITEYRQAEKERLQVLARERAARAEAESANRMKDEFLATLSHELLTPLTAMLGWARLLRSGELDADTAARAVETIENNARLQAQLIEDLLDVSRIILGKLRLGVRPVELTTIIDAALDAVRLAANAKSIRLLRNLDSATGQVLGDPDRLQQVIWNLLSNAVKFTPTEGEVEIRLEKVDRFAQITVRDTGKGIPVAFLPYVFDRFRQADGSSTRVHGGLGLGLAIVRHLVELHGGTAHADSLGEGKGATFSVRLQLMSAQDRLATPLPGSSDTSLEEESLKEKKVPSLRGLNILVLSDEAVERDFLTAVFTHHGAQVTAAHSATEAAALMKRSSPDILVSDFEMTGEAGVRRLQPRSALGEKRNLIPAVAILDESPHAYGEKLLSRFQAHLTRPIDPTRLVRVVSAAVRSKRQASKR